MEFDTKTNCEQERQPDSIADKNIKSLVSTEMEMLKENYEEETDEISQMSNESIEIVMTKGALMLKEINEACTQQVFSNLQQQHTRECPNILPKQMASTPRGGNTFEVLVLPDSEDEDSDTTIDGTEENGERENSYNIEEYVIEVDESSVTDNMRLKVMETSAEAENKVTVDTGAILMEVTEEEAKQYEVEISIDFTSEGNTNDVNPVDTGHVKCQISSEQNGEENENIESEKEFKEDNFISQSETAEDITTKLKNKKDNTSGQNAKPNTETDIEKGSIESAPGDGPTLHVDMTKMFIPINEDNTVQNKTPEIEADEDPSDWMAASINSLIESANEAIMRGISKERILASIPDGQTRDSGTIDLFNDGQIDSAIHASIIENLRLSTSEDFGDNFWKEAKMSNRPNLSQSGPRFQPLLSEVSDSLDADCSSNRSTPISARSNDELLQLLETIDKQGKEMRQELDTAYSRDERQSQECTGDTMSLKMVERFNKEVEVLRDENNRMHREVAHSQEIATKDKHTITSLENSVQKLQDLIKLLREGKRELDKRNGSASVQVSHKESQADFVGCKNCPTLTDRIRQQNKRTDTLDLIHSLRVDASTQVFIPIKYDDIGHLKLDKTLQHPPPSTKSGMKATQMIDDILYQMSTIAANSSGIHAKIQY